MKTLTHILIILIWGQIVYGQEFQKTTDIPIGLLLAKSVYYEKQELTKQIGLDDLIKTRDSLKVRFWDADKIVEIIKNDSIEINVYPIFYSKKGRLITQKLVVENLDKEAFLNRLNNLKIKTLPDYSTISNYKHFNSGFTYCFEISTNDKYRFYSYYRPQNQERIDEAFYVSEIVDFIDKSINWSKLLNDFQENLKFGRYKYRTVIISFESGENYIPCDVEYKKRLFKK